MFGIGSGLLLAGLQLAPLLQIPEDRGVEGLVNAVLLQVDEVAQDDEHQGDGQHGDFHDVLTGSADGGGGFLPPLDAGEDQGDADDGQAVQVFVYYEGDDSRLFTANLNSLAGVTANITFTTGGATVS